MRSRATALPGTAVRPMTSRRAGSDFLSPGVQMPQIPSPFEFKASSASYLFLDIFKSQGT